MSEFICNIKISRGIYILINSKLKQDRQISIKHNKLNKTFLQIVLVNLDTCQKGALPPPQKKTKKTGPPSAWVAAMRFMLQQNYKEKLH